MQPRSGFIRNRLAFPRRVDESIDRCMIEQPAVSTDPLLAAKDGLRKMRSSLLCLTGLIRACERYTEGISIPESGLKLNGGPVPSPASATTDRDLEATQPPMRRATGCGAAGDAFSSRECGILEASA